MATILAQTMSRSGNQIEQLTGEKQQPEKKMGSIDVTAEGRHDSLLADFEKRLKARKIAVSTDDKEVKATLSVWD